MKKRHFFPRFTALFVTAGLLLPPQPLLSLALSDDTLRVLQPGNNSGLEEEIGQVLRSPEVPDEIAAPTAAGLEEGGDKDGAKRDSGDTSLEGPGVQVEARKSVGEPLWHPDNVALEGGHVLEVAAHREIGSRASQQDTYRMTPLIVGGVTVGHVTVRADGMGALPQGERASVMVTDGIPRELQKSPSLPILRGYAGLKEENRALKRPAIQGMVAEAVRAVHERMAQVNIRYLENARNKTGEILLGSTAAVELVVGDEAFVAAVGDTRSYLIRGGKMGLLTPDDSVAWMQSKKKMEEMDEKASWLDMANAVRRSKERHLLIQFLGRVERAPPNRSSGPMPAELGIHQVVVRLEPGDLLLGTTDGVHGVVGDYELLLSAEDPSRPVEQVVADLMGRAKSGTDNRLITLTRCRGPAAGLEEGTWTAERISDYQRELEQLAHEIKRVQPYIELTLKLALGHSPELGEEESFRRYKDLFERDFKPALALWIHPPRMREEGAGRELTLPERWARASQAALSAAENLDRQSQAVGELLQRKFPDEVLPALSEEDRPHLDSGRFLLLNRILHRLIRGFINTNGRFDALGAPGRVDVGRFLKEFCGFLKPDVIAPLSSAQQPVTYGPLAVSFAPAEKGLPEIFVDQNNLLLVLENLVANASHAAYQANQALAVKDRQPVSVSISAHREGDQVVITVRDEGPGIPPGILASLWSGERASSQPLEEGHGFGVGIVRAVVEAAGGSLDIESEPGRGAAFTLRFPAVSAAGLEEVERWLQTLERGPAAQKRSIMDQMTKRIRSSEKVPEGLQVYSDRLTRALAVNLRDPTSWGVRASAQRLLTALAAHEAFHESMDEMGITPQRLGFPEGVDLEALSRFGPVWSGILKQAVDRRLSLGGRAALRWRLLLAARRSRTNLVEVGQQWLTHLSCLEKLEGALGLPSMGAEVHFHPDREGPGAAPVAVNLAEGAGHHAMVPVHLEKAAHPEKGEEDLLDIRLLPGALGSFSALLHQFLESSGAKKAPSVVGHYSVGMDLKGDAVPILLALFFGDPEHPWAPVKASGGAAAGLPGRNSYRGQTLDLHEGKVSDILQTNMDVRPAMVNGEILARHDLEAVALLSRASTSTEPDSQGRLLRALFDRFLRELDAWLLEVGGEKLLKQVHAARDHVATHSGSAQGPSPQMDRASHLIFERLHGISPERYWEIAEALKPITGRIQRAQKEERGPDPEDLEEGRELLEERARSNTQARPQREALQKILHETLDRIRLALLVDPKVVEAVSNYRQAIIRGDFGELGVRYQNVLDGITAAVFASGRTIDEETRLAALLEILDPEKGTKIRAALQEERGKSKETLPPAAGLEEGERIAQWVGETLGTSAVFPEENRASLAAGQEVIVSAGGELQMPILTRVMRIGEDSPAPRGIRSERLIVVEQGLLPSDVLTELSKFGTVQEIGPGQVPEAVAQVRQKLQREGPGALKDLFVVKTGSELETALGSELGRLDSWDFPMAVVALPAGLVSQLSSRGLILYLLDILARADPIPQRRMERLESIRDTGTELQLLSTRA